VARLGLEQTRRPARLGPLNGQMVGRDSIPSALTYKHMLIRIWASLRLTASDDVFRAVADPTRRALLDRLRTANLSVTDLVEPFDMSQPAVSQHLRVLRDAGLVDAEQVGRQRVYRLNAKPLREVFEWSSLYRNLLIDGGGHVWHIGSTPRDMPPGRKRYGRQRRTR